MATKLTQDEREQIEQAVESNKNTTCQGSSEVRTEGRYLTKVAVASGEESNMRRPDWLLSREQLSSFVTELKTKLKEKWG